MKTLTVFTPTYNRAHTLPRTYESLLRQTCKDFEWLVIDDGSTDGTAGLVRGWIEENRIPIRYICLLYLQGKRRSIHRIQQSL